MILSTSRYLNRVNLKRNNYNDVSVIFVKKVF
jgi:hypothetical protein